MKQPFIERIKDLRDNNKAFKEWYLGQFTKADYTNTRFNTFINLDFEYQGFIWLEWCQYNKVLPEISIYGYRLTYLCIRNEKLAILEADSWRLPTIQKSLTELYEEAIIEALKYINETINKIPF